MTKYSTHSSAKYCCTWLIYNTVTIPFYPATPPKDSWQLPLKQDSVHKLSKIMHV